MGFLSALKGIGKGALKFGGLAAAPFTGGASALPAILGAGGAIAGSIAGGREKRRDTEGGQQFQMDATRNSQTLDAEQATMEAERRRMRQMIASDLLGSSSAPTDPRARFGGGGGQIDPATLERIRSSAFKTTPDISAPQFSERPRGGKMDSFLNILGGVGSVAHLLNNRGQPGQDQGGDVPPQSAALDPLAGLPPSRRRPLADFIDEDYSVNNLPSLRNVPSYGGLV